MDWTEIIMDINRAGISGAKIAVRLGVSESGINQLKNRAVKEPLWSTGEQLLKLHKQLLDAGLVIRKQA